MSLNQLKAPRGANRERKRVGRGQASGLGKTAGRGGKGQKARTGNMRFEGFEGGQMPLQRRLPKFGFANPFRRVLEEVQVTDLDALPAGTVADSAALQSAGLVRGRGDGVVVLGKGDIKVALTVKAERVTAGARAAIEKAGGKVEIVPRPVTMGEKAKAAKQAARPPRPAKPDAPPKADKPPKAEKLPKADRPPKAEKPAKADKPKPEKPAKAEEAPKAGEPPKADES